MWCCRSCFQILRRLYWFSYLISIIIISKKPSTIQVIIGYIGIVILVINQIIYYICVKTVWTDFLFQVYKRIGGEKLIQECYRNYSNLLVFIQMFNMLFVFLVLFCLFWVNYGKVLWIIMFLGVEFMVFVFSYIGIVGMQKEQKRLMIISLVIDSLGII